MASNKLGLADESLDLLVQSGALSSELAQKTREKIPEIAAQKIVDGVDEELKFEDVQGQQLLPEGEEQAPIKSTKDQGKKLEKIQSEKDLSVPEGVQLSDIEKIETETEPDVIKTSEEALQRAEEAKARGGSDIQQFDIVSEVEPGDIVDPNAFIVPGQDIQPTEFEQASKTLDAAVDKFEQARKLREQATLQELNSNRTKSAEIAKLTQDSKIEMDQLQSEFASRQKEINADLETSFNKFKTIQDQILKSDIDPKRFVKGLSTGDKFLAIIGIALGGAAGGPNQALRLLENSIDRDIKAQQLNIDSLVQGAKIQGNLITQLQSQFKNELAANNFAKSLIFQAFGQQAKNLQAQTNSADMAAKLSEVRAEALEKSAVFQKDAMEAQRRLKEKRMATTLPFLEGQEFAEDVRKKIQNEFTSAKKTLGSIDTILAIIDGNPILSGMPLTEIQKRAKFEILAMRGAGRLAIIGPGAVSEFEQELLKETFPDLTSFISRARGFRGAFQQGREKVLRDLKTTIETSGGTVPEGLLIEPQTKFNASNLKVQ